MESVSGPWPTMSGKHVDALGAQPATLAKKQEQGGLETAYWKCAHCSFGICGMMDIRNFSFSLSLFFALFLFYTYLFVHVCFMAYMRKSEDKFWELVFSLPSHRFLGSNICSQTQ